MSILCGGILLLSLKLLRTDNPQEIQSQQSTGLQALMLYQSKMHISKLFAADSTYSQSGELIRKYYIGSAHQVGLWYAPSHGQSCIESALDELQKFSTSAPTVMSTVLATFRSFSEFKATIGNNPYDGNTLFLPENELSAALKKCNKPCFFTIDSMGICRNVYFFDSQLTEMNKAYFKNIYECFDLKQSPETTSLGALEKELSNRPGNAEIITTVSLSKQKHDFGKLQRAKPVTAEFTLTNSGINTLTINDVKTTCGCTVPEWSKEPVDPGLATTIKVVYSASDKGWFSKRIFVFTNTKNSPLGFIITGEVE